MSRFWLDCSRSINNGRTEVGWMQKHATEASRLKAAKERAGVELVVLVMGKDEEKSFECAYVRERTPVQMGALKCPASFQHKTHGTAQHSFLGHHHFSVWGGPSPRPRGRESISPRELPAEDIEIRGNHISILKHVFDVLNNVFHKRPGLMIQQNLPTDHFSSHS